MTFTITSGGSGYTSAPAVIFTAASGGTAGTCNAPAITLSGTKVATIGSVTCTGFDRSPVVSFDNTGHGGTGASAAATLAQAVNVTVNNNGSNYTAAPVVTLKGPDDGDGG